MDSPTRAMTVSGGAARSAGPSPATSPLSASGRLGGGREPAALKKTAAFDPTVVYSSHFNPPARHERVTTAVEDREAFRPVPYLSVSHVSRPVTAPGSSGHRDPRMFTLRGSGIGGGAATRHRELAAARLAATVGAGSPPPPAAAAGAGLSVSGSSFSSFGAGSPARPMTASPPKAGAMKPRNNPGNTELRRRYERSELPCVLNQRGTKTSLHWLVEPAKLDMSVYLPIFFDGLRELEHPYKLLAVQGVDDLLAHASAAVLPVVPQLVLPVRQALNTRIPEVILTVMDALEKLLLCDRLAPGGPVIGRALVPYYRQILPVMNIFLTANVNRGDAIEYGQRHRAVIGDRILGVLNLMEMTGGDEAFINIKYMVPTYQSAK